MMFYLLLLLISPAWVVISIGMLFLDSLTVSRFKRNHCRGFGWLWNWRELNKYQPVDWTHNWAPLNRISSPTLFFRFLFLSATTNLINRSSSLGSSSIPSWSPSLSHFSPSLLSHLHPLILPVKAAMEAAFAALGFARSGIVMGLSSSSRDTRSFTLFDNMGEDI